MPPTTALQRSQRLREIALEYNILPSAAPVLLLPPSQPPMFREADDERKADSILGQLKIEQSQQESQHKGSKQLLKKAFKKGSKSDYSYKELYGALLRVIDENGLPGVLEVLLERFLAVDGDINIAKKASTGMFHRGGGSDHQSARGMVLQMATGKRCTPFVQLLAPLADQQSLDASLHIALQYQDKEIVELLLQYGANAAPHEHFLTQAVENNNVDLVDILLRARHKISADCISRSLLPAALNGHSAIVSLLVQAGANGDHDGASALKCAVQTSQVNIVASILLGEHRPSGIAIDQALAVVLATSPTVINNSHRMIELLLCAGPTGTVANDGLVKATQSSDVSLMQLFLKYDVDVNYEGGAAVGHAIKHNCGHLTAILLQDQTLHPDTASELVRSIPRGSSPMDRVAVLSKLLVNGASGINCNELLITAVEQGDMDTVQMLITYGRELNAPPVCSVNYNGARCLQKAIALNHIPMLRFLTSEGRPSSFSLSNAFSAIPEQLGEDPRFMIAETLLQAGAKGPGVDGELLHVVSGPKKSNRLAELFVKHGATVLDETLFSVVSLGSVESVRILLSGSISPATCTAAIPLAMKLASGPDRYHIIQLLIPSAISDSHDNIEISNALVALLQNTPDDLHLLRVLCQPGKANINTHEGLSVELATQLDDCEILDTVLRSSGGVARPATVEKGLKAAILLPATAKYRREKVEMLLRGVKPKIAVDDALIQEVKNVIASKQDLGVIQVLLTAGADVNAREGAPLWGSIPHPELTDLLLTKRPNAASLAKTFKQAMNQPEPARCILCDKLWQAGVSGEINSRSLLHVMKVLKETTSFLPLLRLMVPRSDVNYKEGDALRTAVKNGFTEGVDLLLNARPIVPTAATKSAAFQQAMLIQSLQGRHDIVGRLLKAKIPKSYISEALINAVTSGDFLLSELLIKFGASVEHNSGQAVIFAATSGHHGILKSLVAGEHAARPSLPILENAFMSAAILKTKGDRESYYLVVETLLEAGVRGEALNIALVEAVKEGDVNMKLTEMLHRNGASAEYNDGEAVVFATRAGYFETLSLLLRKQLPESILKEAYVTVADLPNQQRYPVIELLLKAKKSIDRHVINSLLHATQQNPPDRRLIKLLLSHNVFDEGQSMQHAATKQDVETLALLLETPQALPFISTAFNDAINSDDSWKSTKGIEIMKLLLQKGAKGDAVGEALCMAAERSLLRFESYASEFLSVLLQAGANVDYQQGRILQFAVGVLDLDLLQKLLPLASAESKAAAVPLLFLDNENAGMALKFIQAFIDSMEDGDEKIFGSFEHPNPEMNHVLFMALKIFPRKPQILKALLDMGYSPNQSRVSEIDPAIGPEEDPILCWALSQGTPGEHNISNISIENLVDAGANVNFRSKSGFTPLILAILNKRPEIVSNLIAKGVNVKIADNNGVTPLAMASGSGNQEIMELLLQACAEIDDGSVHDAARELKIDSIRLLIKYQHQPDYPSERHNGRSALAELCYRAVDLNPKPADLEEAILCLIGKGANIWLKCVAGDRTEKSMLHYALDSSNPMAILTVLLKLMWTKVNDESFLYVDANYTYSLTKYVEKDIFTGPQEQKPLILHLLRNKRIVDRFWANDIEVDQPEDYCGAPQHIEDEVLRQKLRRKRLVEQRKDTEAALELKRLTIKGEVEIMDMQTAAEIKWANQKGAAELARLKERANAQLQLEMQAESQRDEVLSRRQFGERQHLKEIGDVQIATQRSLTEVATERERMHNMLQIEYVDTNAAKENEALRTRFAIENTARFEADAIAQKAHEREKEMSGMKLSEAQMRTQMQLDFVEANHRKENEGAKARLAIEGAARVENDKLDAKAHQRDMERKAAQSALMGKASELAGKMGGGKNVGEEVGKNIGRILGELTGDDSSMRYRITEVTDLDRPLQVDRTPSGREHHF